MWDGCERENLPRKQYPAENQQADRIPPMRARDDLSSRHFVPQAPSYSLFSCGRYIWFEQKWTPKKKRARRIDAVCSAVFGIYFNTSRRQRCISRGRRTWTSRYQPAALFKPASDVVPHVVWLKGVEQEICCFDQLRCLLVLTKFTIEIKKQKDGHSFTHFHSLIT